MLFGISSSSLGSGPHGDWFPASCSPRLQLHRLCVTCRTLAASFFFFSFSGFILRSPARLFPSAPVLRLSRSVGKKQDILLEMKSTPLNIISPRKRPPDLPVALLLRFCRLHLQPETLAVSHLRSPPLLPRKRPLEPR